MVNARSLFWEFAAECKGKMYDEVLIIADKEATVAHRRALTDTANRSEWREYSSVLADLMAYLRSSLKPKHSDIYYREVFFTVQKQVDKSWGNRFRKT